MKIVLIVAFLSVAFGASRIWAVEKYQKDGLNYHNLYRVNHASPNLTMTAELSQRALLCAKFYSDGGQPHKCPEAKGYGENIAGMKSSAGAPSYDRTMSSGINRWYNESRNYNYEDPENSNGTIGHFTQLVWLKSKMLGLGCASGVDKWTYCVGIYDPAGNIVGQFKTNVLKPKNQKI